MGGSRGENAAVTDRSRRRSTGGSASRANELKDRSTEGIGSAEAGVVLYCNRYYAHGGDGFSRASRPRGYGAVCPPGRVVPPVPCRVGPIPSPPVPRGRLIKGQAGGNSC
jgi:hypothetical protein